MSAFRVTRMAKLAAIMLIIAVGLVHLREAPPRYRFAPYIGIAFLANSVGELVAVVRPRWTTSRNEAYAATPSVSIP